MSAVGGGGLQSDRENPLAGIGVSSASARPVSLPHMMTVVTIGQSRASNLLIMFPVPDGLWLMLSRVRIPSEIVDSWINLSTGTGRLRRKTSVHCKDLTLHV